MTKRNYDLWQEVPIGVLLSKPNFVSNAKPLFLMKDFVYRVLTDNSYNQKVDIWSLGICAIEMAEQHPPYYEMDPHQVVFHIPKQVRNSISFFPNKTAYQSHLKFKIRNHQHFQIQRNGLQTLMTF